MTRDVEIASPGETLEHAAKISAVLVPEPLNGGGREQDRRSAISHPGGQHSQTGEKRK